MKRKSQPRSPENYSRSFTRRDALKLAGLGATAALSGCQLNRVATTPQAREAVSRENARPGTRDWLLAKTRVDPQTRYRCPWIEGYCSHTSVRCGEEISIHVSTNPPSDFTLDVYRMGHYGGNGGRLMRRLGPFKGEVQPDPPVGLNRVRECLWQPCATIRIPQDWLSGVYLGKLTALRDVNDLTVNYYAEIAEKTVDPHYLVKYGEKKFTGKIEESDVVLSRFLHSVIVRVKELFGGKKSKAPKGVNLDRGIEVFRRNLKNISAIAMANDIRLVLLTEPFCRSRKLFEETKSLAVRNLTDPLADYEDFFYGMARYNKAILEVGEEEGVDVIDMASELGDDEYRISRIPFITQVKVSRLLV